MTRGVQRKLFSPDAEAHSVEAMIVVGIERHVKRTSVSEDRPSHLSDTAPARY